MGNKYLVKKSKIKKPSKKNPGIKKKSTVVIKKTTKKVLNDPETLSLSSDDEIISSSKITNHVITKKVDEKELYKNVDEKELYKNVDEKKIDNNKKEENLNNEETFVEIGSKVKSKKQKPNKIIIKLATQILKKLDPKQKLTVSQMEIKLKEMVHQTDDLFEISAIEYLLDSFDTLENQEEKLCLAHENREVQKEKLKGKRIEKEVFISQINLDLAKEDRLPDENDRIFKTGKSIYTGDRQKYLNPKKIKTKEIRKFNNFAKLKKNHDILEQFGI